VRDAIIANTAAELANKEPGFGHSFDAVAADPAKLKALEANLGDFLVFVYGGPNNYKGKSMKDSHASLAITQAQYDFFLTNQVVKALKDKGVPDDDVATCFAPPLVDPAFVADIVTVKAEAKGPGAGLKCDSSGKNAFDTYGAAFVKVRDAIIANTAAELANKEPGFGHSFDAVAADPAKLKTLSDNLADFLVFVYGGPNNYKGKSMTDAHAALGITQPQYDFFLTNQIVKALADNGVPQKDIDTCFAPPLVDPAFVKTIVTKLAPSPRRRTMVNWKRLLAGTAFATVLFVGLVGFAHTKPGRPLRPLLVAMNKVTTRGEAKTGGACPLGYDKNASPAEAEAARKRSVAQFKGTSAAPAHPALAFSLGATTRAEVESWAATNGVSCATNQGPTRIVCSKVPARALPAAFAGLDLDEVYLQFDPDKRLVSVGTVRSTHDADAAVRADGSIAAELTRQVGAPTATSGERTLPYLTAGPLRQARTEFKFSDYYATTSVTSMGQGRLVISERYELMLPTRGAARGPGDGAHRQCSRQTLTWLPHFWAQGA